MFSSRNSRLNAREVFLPKTQERLLGHEVHDGGCFERKKFFDFGMRAQKFRSIRRIRGEGNILGLH